MLAIFSFSQAELICYIFWNIFSALAENLANENILRKVNKSIWKTLKLNNKYCNLFFIKQSQIKVVWFIYFNIYFILSINLYNLRH